MTIDQVHAEARAIVREVFGDDAEELTVSESLGDSPKERWPRRTYSISAFTAIGDPLYAVSDSLISVLQAFRRDAVDVLRNRPAADAAVLG